MTCWLDDDELRDWDERFLRAHPGDAWELRREIEYRLRLARSQLRARQDDLEYEIGAYICAAAGKRSGYS